MRSFVVETREGAPFTWNPGKVSVVCFCAMWCDTWKDQLPRLSKSESELQGLPVDYLAISVDGRWMDRTPGARYAKLLADRGGAWTTSIGIDRVPYTLVIDASGTIRWSAHGILRSDDVVDQVRQALRPATAGPVYLTFDGVSDEILDVLRTEGVTATFFCPPPLSGPVIDRAIREGHSVESLSSSPAGNATLARAPSSSVIRSRKGTLHLFVDDPFDLSRPGEKELRRRILNNSRPRSVIYLHSEVAQTLAVLPEVIANLRSRGFTFAKLQ